jgi:hypothetical protein
MGVWLLDRAGSWSRKLASVNHEDARRLAQALRDELWAHASDDLLTRLGDRGGMQVGLNPPDDVEDDELVDVVWRAAGRAGLADQ